MADETTNKLAGLLRHADDLDKLPTLRAEFERKKMNVDSQLKAGLQDQLQVTQVGMTSVADGQRTLNMIKDEMMKIDKLCAEAQNMIKDFPFVDKIAQTHRNFTQVEEMKSSIDSFGPQMDDIENMLADDNDDLQNQTNLLAIHFEISKLRDIRDRAMDQVRDVGDGGLELINNLQLHGRVTLQDHFARLDDLVAHFDRNIGIACMNLIPLVIEDHTGLIVRLALIVEAEEKRDNQVKALQDAQKEFKDLTSRLKSMNVRQQEPREYKAKLLKSIEAYAKTQFEDAQKSFEENPDKLEKTLRWFFNDLQTVKVGMQNLFPKKWDIFKTYVDIYHRLMHDFLVAKADDKGLMPAHLKSLLNWIDKYYAKMKKLGCPADTLQPHVIDEREHDIVRDYRGIIIGSLEEWMNKMAARDEKSFLSHEDDMLDEDQNGYLRTKSLTDTWRMLRENLAAAGQSERHDVGEGVVDSMMRALIKRQAHWARLVDQEVAPYKAATLTADQEGAHEHLLQWTIALANDQIACIDDNEQTGQPAYVTEFFNQYSAIVSPGWAKLSEVELDSLKDRYVILSTQCISAFVSLIYCDCRDPNTGNSVFDDFFTSRWTSVPGPMPKILATADDYHESMAGFFHASLRDILVEEFAEELLVRYLSSVTKNSSVKFKRSDEQKTTDLVRQDIKTVFETFSKYPDSFDAIKAKWRIMSFFLELINAPKGDAVVAAYESWKTNNWDLQMTWVEGVLKTRDDYDRAMLAAVKARAAQMHVERGETTVMSKVK